MPDASLFNHASPSYSVNLHFGWLDEGGFALTPLMQPLSSTTLYDFLLLHAFPTHSHSHFITQHCLSPLVACFAFFSHCLLFNSILPRLSHSQLPNQGQHGHSPCNATAALESASCPNRHLRPMICHFIPSIHWRQQTRLDISFGSGWHLSRLPEPRGADGKTANAFEYLPSLTG